MPKSGAPAEKLHRCNLLDTATWASHGLSQSSGRSSLRSVHRTDRSCGPVLTPLTRFLAPLGTTLSLKGRGDGARGSVVGSSPALRGWIGRSRSGFPLDSARRSSLFVRCVLFLGLRVDDERLASLNHFASPAAHSRAPNTGVPVFGLYDGEVGNSRLRLGECLLAVRSSEPRQSYAAVWISLTVLSTITGVS